MGRRAAATWCALAFAVALLTLPGNASAAPAVNLPPLPPVTLPPVTVPTIPTVTVPPVDLPGLVEVPPVTAPLLAPEQDAVPPATAPAAPAPAPSPAPEAGVEAAMTPAGPVAAPAPAPAAAPRPPVSLTRTLGDAAGSFAVPLSMLALLVVYAVASVVRDRRDRSFVEAGAVERWLPFR